MLEILENLIKQNAQKAVVENKEIPNEHNENVVNEIFTGVLGGLNNQAQSQGGLGSLLGLLTGNQVKSNDSGSLMSHPVVAGIAASVIGNIVSKFGISHSAASGIMGNVLPNVLGGLISKTNDPKDSSINLDGIMNVLSQGKTSGINFGSMANMAGNVFADGKLDLSDLLRVASGAGKSNTQESNNSGGGLDIGSLLGGLMGGK